ncbi:MAG: hypothetical protein RMJ87_08640 [Cytophagales bacterium]|nr:hypothetical protein [Cytophagales bacterium]
MLNITNFAKARRYLNINLIAQEAGIDVQVLFEKLAAEENLQPTEASRLIDILSKAGIQLRTWEVPESIPLTSKSAWVDELKALPLEIHPEATLYRDFFYHE